MSGLLMKAVIAITLALIFYTIGVWTEHFARRLKKIHLLFFWAGLVMDATGTRWMSMISGETQSTVLSAHAITGTIAIILMLIHAVWATVVIVRNNEEMQKTFHRFSLTVWVIWLIPFVLGMVMGMRG